MSPANQPDRLSSPGRAGATRGISGAALHTPLVDSQPSFPTPQPHPSPDPFAFASSDDEGQGPTAAAGPIRGDGKTATRLPKSTLSRAPRPASQQSRSQADVDPWVPDSRGGVIPKVGSQSQHDPEFLRSLVVSAGEELRGPELAVHRQSNGPSRHASGSQMQSMLPPPSPPRGWSSDHPQASWRGAPRCGSQLCTGLARAVDSAVTRREALQGSMRTTLLLRKFRCLPSLPLNEYCSPLDA